jgi:glycosyltransferase involved in cell wall biosynthesis
VLSCAGNKNLKVTLIGTYPPQKGISAYCGGLSSSLSHRIEVEFISFKKIYPKFLHPVKNIINDKMFIPTTNDNLKVKTILKYYNPLTWFRVGLFSEGNIIHIQWWTTFLFPIFFTIAILSKIKGKIVIITAHNIIPHERHILDITLVKLLFGLADRIIVHSNRNIDQINAMSSKFAEKTIVIPHGILDKYICSEVSKDEYRSKLGLPLQSKIILFFGGIRDYKGLDVLIETMHHVIECDKSIILCIAGQPWASFKKYNDLIRKFNLESNVKLFLSFIPDSNVESFFRSADLVVLPYTRFSSQSGFGLTALAFEIPLIVTDVGGLSELVKDKNFVVEPNNPRALAEKILLALGDDELLKKLSEDSRDLAEEYSWDKIAEKTVELYKFVLDGERGLCR